jgi:hypothetical protein
LVAKGKLTIREIEEQFVFSTGTGKADRATLHGVLEGFYWAGILRFRI